MTREEEALVIQAVLAGDTNRFEALVDAYQKSVYNLALRMLGSAEDALDASQEAFFRTYRALDDFRGESKFSVWLYRLASNVCLDMLRKRSRRNESSLTDEDDDEFQLPDERFCPQTELEKKELRQTVRRALERLAPPFRQILVLREVSGLSYEEISAITGLEPGTVKSRLFRARKKMAGILMRDGNFSEISSSFSMAGIKGRSMTEKGGTVR